MKKVTIPTCANPFVVIVNGMKYTYPAGETVEVPDDVAAVIEQHDEAHNNPQPAPVVPPFEPAASEGGLTVVEISTNIANGTALSSEEGAALDNACAAGVPFLVIAKSAQFGNVTFENLAAYTILLSQGGASIVMIACGASVVSFVNTGSAWVCSVA